MAGIYIHIPYCKQACIYCNFHFSTQVKNKPALVEALLHEIEERTGYLEGEVIETIYFGGGTPSLLTPNELQNILDKIQEKHHITPNPEITLEANPDDLSAEKIKSLRESGINRLSIGVQSFLESDLDFLQRAHTSAQAIDSIKNAQDAGISNITIDLIYGIPGQSDETWMQNLEMVKSLGIPHFSAYSLTVEPRTQLDHLVKEKQLANVDDAQTERNFRMLMDWAETNGYIHYEISNFCLPDMYSRHNSSYWKGKKYLGIGPSAHSYDGKNRQWNISNNANYIKFLSEGKSYSEIEVLSTSQKFNEYLLTTLRTIWGADMKKIKTEFGMEYYERLQAQIIPYITQGYMLLENNKLTLTREGKLIADTIVSDLFVV